MTNRITLRNVRPALAKDGPQTPIGCGVATFRRPMNTVFDANLLTRRVAKFLLGVTTAFSLIGFAGLAFADPKPTKSGGVEPLTNYAAKTAGQAKKQGILEAAGTKWSCRNSICTASAPFSALTVASCQALRSQVGNIKAFGAGKKFLTADELKKCNTAPARPGSIAAPGDIPRTATLTPALTKQIMNRTELFRRVQTGIAQQQRQAGILARERTGGTGGGIHSAGDDCDDHNASVHPGATEVCNVIDDNCNGRVDEGVLATFYLDADGDGHGDPGRALSACPHQIGTMSEGAYLVPLGNDCNDSNPDQWHDC